MPFTEVKCKSPVSFCGYQFSPISLAGQRQNVPCPWSSLQTKVRPQLFNNCTVSLGPGVQVDLNIGISHLHRICFKNNGFNSCLGYLFILYFEPDVTSWIFFNCHDPSAFFFKTLSFLLTNNKACLIISKNKWNRCISSVAVTVFVLLMILAGPTSGSTKNIVQCCFSGFYG